MMVLHCRKVEIQGDEEAGGAVRRTWEGRRKREVECTEEKLLVLLVKGGVLLSYQTSSLCCSPDRKCLLLPLESTSDYVFNIEREREGAFRH